MVGGLLFSYFSKNKEDPSCRDHILPKLGNLHLFLECEHTHTQAVPVSAHAEKVDGFRASLTIRSDVAAGLCLNYYL